MEGLIDKRLEQVSHRRAPVDEVLRLVDRYWSRHTGVECQALLCLVPTGWRGAELHLGEERLTAGEVGGEGAQTGRASQAAGAKPMAGDVGASGRFHP